MTGCMHHWELSGWRESLLLGCCSFWIMLMIEMGACVFFTSSETWARLCGPCIV